MERVRYISYQTFEKILNGHPVYFDMAQKIVIQMKLIGKNYRDF